MSSNRRWLRWRRPVRHLGMMLVVSGITLIAVSFIIRLSGTAADPVGLEVTDELARSAVWSTDSLSRARTLDPARLPTADIAASLSEFAAAGSGRAAVERLVQRQHRGLGFDAGSIVDGSMSAKVVTTNLMRSPTLSAALASPTHITIPEVGVDTVVVEVMAEMVNVDDRLLFRWQVADWAAGHHDTSANPGEGGNVVLAGHDDVRGEVFRGLHNIAVGDEVVLTTSMRTFIYVVEEIHYRQDAGASVEDRLATGTFLAPMPEERLTLVTCWPYQIDSHRLIVVAKPR